MFLLVGAGLFVRSLLSARAIDAGFDPSNMIVMMVVPELQGYDQARGRALYDNMLSRVAAVPGAQSATLAESVPLSIGGSRRGTAIEGYQPQPGEDTETAYNVVAPRYFETMRIPMVRGRSFTDADRAGAPPVVIVNEAFARPLLAERRSDRQAAQRQRIRRTLPRSRRRDAHREIQHARRRPAPSTICRCGRSTQERSRSTSKPPAIPRASIGSVREAIRAVDPNVPVVDVKTMDEQMLVALLPARLAGTLLGAFGLLALLLASVGIYGVMAYARGVADARDRRAPRARRADEQPAASHSRRRDAAGSDRIGDWLDRGARADAVRVVAALRRDADRSAHVRRCVGDPVGWPRSSPATFLRCARCVDPVTALR